MRYLAVYSHVALGDPPAFGNVEITTDGPVNTVAAVRKVEAVIGHDVRASQVVLLNLLPLTAVEPAPEDIP